MNRHTDLLRRLFDINFSKPSKIQERALPLLLRDPQTAKYMLSQSPTRMGKTAAFVLTMLSRVDALCVAPSRERACQIMAVVKSMDYIKRRILDVSEVKILVLDEAGNMLDEENFREQCVRIKNMLPRQHPTQIVLFSSTFPNHVRTLVSRFAPNANKVELKKG
ncbi:P-loop containing nucleoside triphosphate hydrolase protein [Rickenella mellea]|uniref:P-loop containing nucleoside triphosphate hydrolase protein n=1 Tax=Rickenella mellea TaxID=50990 RepID=A0A4Y7PNS8_9AGAM|nr:P-loop containing nucleoside triphosphate hydrolase protein [Rickenella mellea]